MTVIERRERAAVRRPRTIPGYVLNLRPVEVIVHAVRRAMTWSLAARIVLLLYGGFGLVFLLIVRSIN